MSERDEKLSALFRESAAFFREMCETFAEHPGPISTEHLGKMLTQLRIIIKAIAREIDHRSLPS